MKRKAKGKKRKSRTKMNEKHELYPLNKIPSPQVLCNKFIPNKRT
jgi:hypothetical protein